jgi:hypothetical protein
VPSSCDTARASAVFPVPGPPASRTARPDIFFALIRSTTTPQACHPYISRNFRRDEKHGHTSLAAACPTKPWPEGSAVPSCLSPRPLMCVCAAVRFSRALPLTSLMLTILCASMKERNRLKAEKGYLRGDVGLSGLRWIGGLSRVVEGNPR